MEAPGIEVASDHAENTNNVATLARMLLISFRKLVDPRSVLYPLAPSRPKTSDREERL